MWKCAFDDIYYQWRNYTYLGFGFQHFWIKFNRITWENQSYEQIYLDVTRFNQFWYIVKLQHKIICDWISLLVSYKNKLGRKTLVKSLFFLFFFALVIFPWPKGIVFFFDIVTLIRDGRGRTLSCRYIEIHMVYDFLEMSYWVRITATHITNQ